MWHRGRNELRDVHLSGASTVDSVPQCVALNRGRGVSSADIREHLIETGLTRSDPSVLPQTLRSAALPPRWSDFLTRITRPLRCVPSVDRFHAGSHV